MKQKLKKQKWYHYLLFILLAVTIVFACKKIETTNTQLNTEDKFFSNHYPTNAKTNAILNYVKRQNEQKHFVDKVVTSVGYPHWDKTLIVSNKAKTQRTNSDSTEVFYIPFALPNDSTVKAILVIKTTNADTVHRFICNWQYKNFLSPTDTANKIADKMALLFMILEKNTFLHEKFKLKDTSLFNNHSSLISDTTKRTLTLKTIENVSGRTNLVTTLHICFDVIECGSVAWCDVHGGCDAPDPCPFDICHVIAMCDYIDIDFGSGDGGILTGGGGGDSGGGGGGGSDWIPPTDCYSGRTSTPNLPPCEPGWEPVEDNPVDFPTPCEKANNLKNDPVSIGKFKQLQLLVNSDHEEAYAMPQSANGAIQHFIGNSNDKKVKSTLTNMVRSHLHNHYNDVDELSLFSPDDFSAIAQFFSGNKINPNNFTMGVTTSFGTNYIMVIDDPTAFSNFINSYVYDENTNENLPNLFTRYGIHHSSTIAANELAMLQLFKDKGSGIKMLKADANFTQFEELTLNRDSKIVVPIPCN
jgi:hypothetical protein